MGTTCCRDDDESEDEREKVIEKQSHKLSAFDFFMSDTTTIAVIFGYFRKNEFLDYNVECSNFISIISKYIENKSIKIGNNNINIDIFDAGNHNISPNNLDVLNKNFIVGTTTSHNHMLSICVTYITCICTNIVVSSYILE